MQDEIPSTSEKSERYALTLAPGNVLAGLSVFQVDQPHQTTLVQTAEVTARHARTDAGMQGSAIFRAIGKGDVAVFTQWLNQSSYDQTEPTLLKPPKQDFQAIFRKLRLTMAFAQVILSRSVPGPPRLPQYDLVAVSLSRATQMEHTR